MLIDYYLYYLTFPIIVLPIIALYGLIDKKSTLMFTLSFFISAIAFLVLNSAMIATCILLISIIAFAYTGFIISFFKKQKPDFAIVVSKSNNCIVLKHFDGTDDVRLNVISPEALNIGSILRLTEK